ncbi:hypothetical protein O3G_MSEX008339 [Manduca sexta]|uniref:Uncharacterized protein n=1 Tax=Manduca sexta TaxID=7130 RepID=A0A921ZA31_MANSE|nr:hypothetical protein O3G_MSEX008339 [Manduca sexta]
MTTTAKSQKDKLHTPSPRLLPRPTAASAARAARNATNRNVSLVPSQRQSPPRSTTLPANTKNAKNVLQRTSQKTESKTDMKVISNSENEHPAVDNNFMTTPQNTESFVIENYPTEVVEQIDAIDITEDHVTERNDMNTSEVKNSCPSTPAVSSRPQTPRSQQWSRPQTPRVLSRPTTPAQMPQRHGTPTSRPNTPRRPSTPTRPITTYCMQSPCNKYRPESPVSTIAYEDDDIKSTFTTKHKQFQRLKKELDLKQQAVLELFDTLRSLRDRMMREGITDSGEGLQQQELVVFNVADWAADEIAQLCRDALASSNADDAIELINNTLPIDERALAELDVNMENLPARFADLCLQAFAARQEIIEWAKELIGNNEQLKSVGLERIAQYNAQGLELCEILRELKTSADSTVDTITQLSKRACRERNALIAVGESLVREIARLRQDIEVRTAFGTELRDTRADTETAKALEDARHELEEERVAKAVIKDKLATAESQLRQTRGRISKMDRQLREAEASISSLTGTVKTLEDQSRQREVQLEARARKLKESLKTGEVASGQIAQQRDALQAELLELKEEIAILTNQHKATTQGLNNQIKEARKALENEHEQTQKQISINESAQALLEERESKIKELQAKITELENSRPNPDLPTEREMDLWAELQATKETLRTTEDEVTACKREKVRFLETLTKIAESDNKVGMQQKLAAELLSKEEIMGKMQMQIRDLTKNIKLNEQKVIQYEQYVRDIQAHNRAVANCQEAPNGISYQDLQQEIMNVRMGLLEAVHRNEELTELLMQKEQQLEQQDKTSRAQARVIKVNKQIAAKADEIQELFATLENKQQQIHRLEKIVIALEEQQRRAQAQRTRHEEKIAALEHELAAGGNRRERKFLFF